MIATQQTAQHVVTLAQTAPSARYVVLDIETGDAPEEAILAAVAGWKAPSNWKPETVEKNRAEHAEKVRDKAALLDASPIICVGCRSDLSAVMFSGMGTRAGLPPLDLSGWALAALPDERSMLSVLGVWLDGCTDESTVLAGHNIRGFDLPKLRGAYVRHRLPLPTCLKPRDQGSQPIADTMSLFKHFSMEHRDSLFVGLDAVAAAFGVARPKAVISGADVPRLHREGQHDEILIYGCVDVDTTAEIYRLMMS